MLRIDDNGKPIGPGIPGWTPATADEITLDLLAREISRIAFDDAQPPAVRLKAMTELGKRIGFAIERSEVKTIDETKKAAMIEMFANMSPQQRFDWLQQVERNHPVETEIEAKVIESESAAHHEACHALPPHEFENPDPPQPLPAFFRRKQQQKIERKLPEE